MAHPLAPRASRLVRWSRTTAVVATLVVVLATVVHGWGVATGAPSQDVLTPMEYVEVSGDYVAWTHGGHERARTSAHYVANGTPSDVMVIRQADLAALLSGAEFTPVERLPPPLAMGGLKSMGRIDFQPPGAICPPPTGACQADSRVLLVWVKGDAWRGSTLEDVDHYVVTHEGWTGPAPPDARDGPVSARLASTTRSVYDAAPLWMGTALLAGLVGLLALGVHAFASWRTPASARAPLAAGIGAGGTTEERLLLVRLASLYADGVRRSYRTSLATIVAITAAVLFFALPPMLERVVAQFAFLWEMQEAHVAFFILAPLDVMLVAIGMWTVSYVGVRRELAAWHTASRAVEQEAADIVGA